MSSTITETSTNVTNDAAIGTQEQGPSMMMWERVVPASTRMLEFLGLEGREVSKRPPDLRSALQLTKFYLGRGDLEAAKDLLSLLQDGRGGSIPVAPALLRPLFQVLIGALCRAGEAEAAMDTSARMARAGQALSKESLVALLECCAKGSKGPRLDLASSILQGLSEADAWRKEPKACLALLELRAVQASSVVVVNNKVESSSSLPGLLEIWSALLAHGKPSLRAHVALIKGLSGRLVEKSPEAAAGDISRLHEAMADLAADTSLSREMSKDEKILIQEAFLSAARAMVILGDAKSLEHVLTLFPLNIEAYESLLKATQGNSEMLELLWQHVNGIKGDMDRASSSFNLTFSQMSLLSGEEKAVSKALEILRSLKRADWVKADTDAIAGILTALCQRGLIDEIKMVRRVTGATYPSPLPPKLSRALLACAALEGRPGRAITLLRSLGDNATPQDYETILQSMVSMRLPPPSSREKELLESPGEFLTWAIDGMGSDGPSPTAVRLAIQILERACQLSAADSPRDMWAQRAVALVNGSTAKGSPPDDATCEALVGVTVFGNHLRSAIQVVEQMETLKAASASLARAQSLLISSMAKRGDLMEAEEWLLRMVTVTGLGPSETIMDDFTRSYAAVGNVSSGLSMLQGCFTQYGARPSAKAFIILLDYCIQQKDPYEAQRAVTIAEQLWEPGHPCLQEIQVRWKTCGLVLPCSQDKLADSNQ